MAERARISVDEAHTAACDVQDVLMLVGLMLNAEPEDMPARHRDALATLIRLGEDRAQVVHMGLDNFKGGRS